MPSCPEAEAREAEEALGTRQARTPEAPERLVKATLAVQG